MNERDFIRQVKQMAARLAAVEQRLVNIPVRWAKGGGRGTDVVTLQIYAVFTSAPGWYSVKIGTGKITAASAEALATGPLVMPVTGLTFPADPDGVAYNLTENGKSLSSTPDLAVGIYRQGLLKGTCANGIKIVELATFDLQNCTSLG